MPLFQTFLKLSFKQLWDNRFRFDFQDENIFKVREYGRPDLKDTLNFFRRPILKPKQTYYLEDTKSF